MSSAIESLKDFFKDCPILDDNSTRGEVVKFLLKILLFLQIHVVNFRLPLAHRKLLDGDFPPALRQIFGEDEIVESASDVEEDETTVSLSSVLSAVDDERREDGGENEVQEDSGAEVPITFSSTSSSKASSRKDRGGGGSSGGIEQFLLMDAMLERPVYI